MNDPFHKRFGDSRAWLCSQEEQQLEAVPSTGRKIRPKSSPWVAPCFASIPVFQNPLSHAWSHGEQSKRSLISEQKTQIFNTKTAEKFCSCLLPSSQAPCENPIAQQAFILSPLTFCYFKHGSAKAYQKIT